VGHDHGSGQRFELGRDEPAGRLSERIGLSSQLSRREWQLGAPPRRIDLLIRTGLRRRRKGSSTARNHEKRTQDLISASISAPPSCGGGAEVCRRVSADRLGRRSEGLRRRVVVNMKRGAMIATSRSELKAACHITDVLDMYRQQPHPQLQTRAHGRDQEPRVWPESFARVIENRAWVNIRPISKVLHVLTQRVYRRRAGGHPRNRSA